MKSDAAFKWIKCPIFNKDEPEIGKEKKTLAIKSQKSLKKPADELKYWRWRRGRKRWKRRRLKKRCTDRDKRSESSRICTRESSRAQNGVESGSIGRLDCESVLPYSLVFFIFIIFPFSSSLFSFLFSPFPLHLLRWWSPRARSSARVRILIRFPALLDGREKVIIHYKCVCVCRGGGSVECEEQGREKEFFTVLIVIILLLSW